MCVFIRTHMSQLAPIFFDYQRTPLSLKKTKIALDIFNTYLQRENSEYAAGSEYTYKYILLYNKKIFFINI